MIDDIKIYDSKDEELTKGLNTQSAPPPPPPIKTKYLYTPHKLRLHTKAPSPLSNVKPFYL